MFKVIMTFSNGDTHTEEHGEDTVGGALQRLTCGPAARMGIITEVQVVDMLDCTNFKAHWNGQQMQVTFPTQLTA
jgi:hypothetical protein